MKEQKRKRTFAVVSTLAAVLILGFFGLMVHQTIKRNQGAPGKEPIPITASSEDQENTADSGTSLQDDSASEEAGELSRQEEESVAREVEEQSRQEAERLAREAREEEERQRMSEEEAIQQSIEESRYEAALRQSIEESRYEAALAEAERKKHEWETSPVPSTKLDFQEARAYFTNPVSFEEAEWPPENIPDGLEEFLSIYFSLYEDPREDLGFTFVHDSIVRYWKVYYKYPHTDDWSVNQGKNCIEDILYNEAGLILVSVKYKDIVHLVNLIPDSETGWTVFADYGREYGDETFCMGPNYNYSSLEDIYRSLLTHQEAVMPITAENLSAAEENLKTALLDRPLYELLPDGVVNNLYSAPLRDYIPEGKTDEYLASVKVYYDHRSSLETLVARCIYPGWKIENINVAFCVLFDDTPPLVLEGYDKDFKPEDRVYICRADENGGILHFAKDLGIKASDYLKKAETE